MTDDRFPATAMSVLDAPAVDGPRYSICALLNRLGRLTERLGLRPDQLWPRPTRPPTAGNGGPT